MKGGIFMRSEQKEKVKRWAKHGLVILLAIVGLLMIFHRQILAMGIHHMQTQANEQKIGKLTKKEKRHGNFNYNSVQAVNTRNMLAALNHHGTVIGKISVPQLGIHLPIYYGVSMWVLIRGAGTMSPAQKMGYGNYALASHHVPENNLLFTPLMRAKKGMRIYLTNGKKVYTYRIYRVTTVNEHDMSVLQPVKHKKVVTLITCSSWRPCLTRRIVQGKLIRTRKATVRNSEVFLNDNQPSYIKEPV